MFHRFQCRLAAAVLLPLLFLFALPVKADDLGQFILDSVKSHPEQPLTEGAMLLLTRDLDWYGKHMAELPQQIQDDVQNLRIRLVGESARQAAEALGEPADVFLASGSCKPARDIDVLYVGGNTREARARIERAIRDKTAAMLAAAEGDPLFKAARNNGLKIPASLTSDAMEIVTSDLPNFAYKDLNDAVSSARTALKAGDANAIDQFKQALNKTLQQNLEAQVAASAKDMYRGAAGQRFFNIDYLGDPEKVRRIVSESGNWVLKPGGPEAISELLQEQVIALMPTSRRAKFAKVATDYAMFFKHGEEGGLSGTAKYVKRIWEDVDSTALLIHIGDTENKALLVARAIAEKPNQASTILALNGLSELDVENGVQRAMHQWVENQLIIDVDSLVKELDSVKLAQAAGSADELEALFRKQLVQFDLNDLASGLSAMSQVPGKGPAEILGVLEKEFSGSDAGQLAIRYIRQQLEIFADNSVDSVGMRLIRALVSSGEISPADYHELRSRMLKGQELPAEAAKKLQKARSEVLFLGSVNMLELDTRPGSIDQLIDDWKRSRSSALISVADDDVRKTISELSQLPADELKKLGWLEAELKLPMETRLRIKLLPDQAADMAERLGRNLSKQALTLNQWQRQARKYIFDLTPAEFGEAGDLGAMDVVFSVANGLYKTYSILNSSPPMKPADENLALANAWVTALPIVGDFADGILSGIEAGFTGNKAKALESGLFVTIGVMGVVPGGQIPAVVASLIAASAPIAGGVYDASQAQDLIQAWIESGNWEGGGDQPMVLAGLFDRAQGHHEISYEELLTTKGNVPYQSERADGLLSVPTLNGSIRDYAEKYVFPQYPKIKELRESLKVLFPTFNDKIWEDEFDAKLRIDREGGKAALFLFREYYQIRTQALNQTLAQLKTWAEEERRVAQDYEAEVEKATQALIKLQDELNAHSLVSHAKRSADAYTKIIKNVMEHETLPLSRYRIYKHYLQEYQQIARLVRQIKARLAVVKGGYQPANWFLTGYPEFDKPRISKLAAMIDNGHKSVVEKVTGLIKDLGFRARGGYDPKNSCHQDAYAILAAIRHKISFLENLEEYYKELASSESAWNDAYETARSRYLDVRDSLSDSALTKAQAESKQLADAVISFMAAMPYALASNERDLYKSTASNVGIRLQKAMSEFEMAGYLTGKAGAALEGCLLKSLKIDVALKPYTPKLGETTIATARLNSATPPAEYFWRWKTSGPLKIDTPYGEKVNVVVDGAGELIVELTSHYNPQIAKVLAESYVKIAPLSGEAEPEDDAKKRQEEEKKAEKDRADTAPDSTADFTPQGRDWKRLVDAEEATRKDKDMRNNRTAEWDKRMQSIRSDLAQLRDVTKQWLLAWEPYIRELEKVDNKVYHDLRDAVEKQREAYFARCFNNGGESNPAVADACKKKSYDYEESCLPKSLRLAHSDEQKRIRIAKTELPQELHIMASTGFPASKTWFEKVDQLAEKHGLPFPYPQTTVPRVDYTSQCASVDIEKEKKEPQEFLKVKLAGPSAVVSVGKPVTLSAGVTGGKPPYQYAWSGATGSGTTASLTPSWAGDWSVSVTVTDAEGNSGEGVTTVRVAPSAIKIKGLKGNVFYGSTAALNAFDQGVQAPEIDHCAKPDNPFCVDTSVHATMAASSAAPKEILSDSYVSPPDEEEEALPPPMAEYKVIWQSEPGLTFDPPDSFNGQTTVTYDRMGEVKIWCELLQAIEGSYQTVGECDQETVQVIPPAFTVTFEPQNGQAYVGQQVLATLHAKPSVPGSLIDYRWFDPASSNRLEIGPNGNRISFTIKDTQPIKLKALARVPVHGDEIGEIESSYTGVAYSVKAWVVQLPNQPMTWDPAKGGLKPIPHGSRAVFDRITLKAELQGGTKPDVIRWQWAVNEGTSLSNPASQSPTVSRSEPGDINATVIALDKDGRKLGEAEVSLTVIKLTPAPTGKDKAKDPRGNKPADKPLPDKKPDADKPADGPRGDGPEDKAKKGLDEANQQAASGNMPAAERAVREAEKFAPKLAAPAAKQIAHKAKLSGWAATYERDFDKGMQDLEVSVRLNPADKDAQEKLAKAKRFAKAWPAVEAKAAEFDRLIAADKVWSAHKALLQMEKLHAEMPGQIVNPLSRRVSDEFNKALQAYNKFMEQVDKTNSWSFKKKDWQKMLENARQSQQRELSPSHAKEANSRIAFAEKMLREQQQKDPPLAELTASERAAPMSGVWKTTEGVMTLLQRGDQVEGSYNADGGKIKGTYQSGVFDGYWSENSASVRCKTALDGRYHWGRLRLEIKDGKMSGIWSYCDADPTDKSKPWSGTKDHELPGSAGGIAEAANGINGVWKSTEGTITFTQNGDQVKGTYPVDGGTLIGTIKSGVLDGYWIENNSSHKCKTKKDGRYYWGRIHWTFSGNSFKGQWSYCDAPVNKSASWSGSRQ